MNKVHALLCILRILCIFLPGYIHPDEWFQSPEVMASRIFGTKGYIPWEYDPAYPCRSPTVAKFMTGIPFSIIKLFTSDPSSIVLYLVPRLYICSLSFVLDGCIRTLSKMFPKEINMDYTLNLLAMAWPVLVFGVRPFSNTIELILVAASITLCVKFSQSRSYKIAFIIGVIMGFGTMTRITFVVFGGPIGLFFLWTLTKNRDKDTFKNLVKYSLPVIVGYMLTIIIMVTSDCFYFGRFAFAPLNSFQYNTNVDNLRLHGFHPRWIHSVVNMPMLLGPLCITLIISVFIRPTRSPLMVLCLGVIATSLASLSSAPHQELRFLLPLVFPAVIIGQWVVSNKKLLKVLLMIAMFFFNAFFFCFFGIFHQGGVSQAILYMSKYKDQNATLAFCKTYMPPRHLLGIPADNDNFEIVDLGGSCDIKEFVNTNCTKHKNIWVAVPASLKDKEIKDLTNFGFTLEKNFWPHLTTEYPPHNVDEMSLDLYKKI